MPDNHVISPPDPMESEPDYRFTLANERTFLAWQRTSLGLLAAAVAVLHFLPAQRPHLAYGLGGTLGALATLTAGWALVRWRRADEAIRDNRPLPPVRLPAVLAVTLSCIGVATVIVAVAIWA